MSTKLNSQFLFTYVIYRSCEFKLTLIPQCRRQATRFEFSYSPLQNARQKCINSSRTQSNTTLRRQMLGFCSPQVFPSTNYSLFNLISRLAPPARAINFIFRAICVVRAPRHAITRSDKCVLSAPAHVRVIRGEINCGKDARAGRTLRHNCAGFECTACFSRAAAFVSVRLPWVCVYFRGISSEGKMAERLILSFR